MPFYRTKPVVVDAFQFTAKASANSYIWPVWLSEAATKADPNDRRFWETELCHWFVGTKSEAHRVFLNDWIINDMHGSPFTVLSPAAFAALYEPTDTLS